MRGIGIGVEIAEDEIQGLIEEILNTAEGMDDMDSVLTQLAIDIQNQLRRGRFTDRSGNLRRSMRVFVENNTLKIRMAAYGYFLSFGTRDGAKSPLTTEVASIFNKGENETSFFNQPDNNKGIARRSFYPTNIEQRILVAMEAMIAENLD